MPLGPGADGPAARRSASAPTHRPPWLLLLSSITLVYGGLLLVSGLIALRNPASAAKFPIARPLAPEEEALTRELIAVNTDIVARHAGAIRARAGASTLLALLMLYAAAAALSRDRNGRAATLIAAWLGIVYQVASLPMLIPIAEDYATTSAPILARMVASDLPHDDSHSRRRSRRGRAGRCRGDSDDTGPAGARWGRGSAARGDRRFHAQRLPGRPHRHRDPGDHGLAAAYPVLRGAPRPRAVRADASPPTTRLTRGSLWRTALG